MARQIDWSKSLSKDDLAYIAQRPWMVFDAKQNGVENIDEQLHALQYDDLAQFVGDDVQHDSEPVPGTAPEGAAATPPEQPGEGAGPDNAGDAGEPEEEGDNYDDDEAWTYDDVKAEVKDRREAGAEDAPALNSSREVLVAWLREDDARSVDEDSSDDES